MKLDFEALKAKLNSFRTRGDKQKSIPLGETIFVDMTPPSHKKVVELRQLKKQWRYGVFGVAALCTAASMTAFGMSAQSQGLVTSEIAKQQTITQNTSKYAEVNKALEVQKVAVDSLDKAAGTEIDWNKMISSIEGSLPSGTRISAISVTGGGTKPTGNDPGVAAIINLNLSSATTLGYSDALKSIQSTPGIKSVDISGLKTESDRYTYSLSFSYDTSVLTGRYAAKDKG